MAAVPQQQRLKAEDYQDQSKWIGKLLQPLNTFFEQFTQALNKQLTINENFAGQIRDVTIDGSYPLKLAWSVRRRPMTVLVGGIRRADGTSITLTEAVFVQWQFNQAGELQIDGVVGLPAPASSTIKYVITLEIKAG